MKKHIRNYLKVLVEHEIVRRYIIINSFDGALTILGIIMAVFIGGFHDPKLIILPSVGARISMCVSGIWGSYAAERAEIRKKIRQMETHLMHDLTGTEFSRKREEMAWIIGVVDGTIPLILAIILILPFFFVVPGMITISVAYYISLSLIGLNLFVIGLFAGKIAQENMFKQGFIMLLAGVMIGIIFYLLALTGIL